MKISLAFYDLNNGIINLDHIKKVNINLNFGVLSCKVCSFNLTVYSNLCHIEKLCKSMKYGATFNDYDRLIK